MFEYVIDVLCMAEMGGEVIKIIVGRGSGLGTRGLLCCVFKGSFEGCVMWHQLEC